MSSIFCCPSPSPYRQTRVLHEPKFEQFLSWVKRFPLSSPSSDSGSYFKDPDNLPDYAVQFVRQVNFGPLEAKCYFIPSPPPSRLAGLNGDEVVREFIEVTEQDLIAANFKKLNSFKNFKCTLHDKFFEVNLYQKDLINHHHWRADLARPAADIDL